ncbi:MAG: Dabb family protein [Mariprofundaceae bacterium]|nr:Dabb family protein [Mariprofundaceae bacterium]
MPRPRDAWFLSVAIALFLSGCAAKQPGNGRVGHVVICWLKEPGNAEARRNIIVASKSFGDIPGVVNVHAGNALPSQRRIVDDSFDVAIVITFASEQAMRAYLDHPTHKNAVERVIRPLVRKIVVYDFTMR